VIQNGYDEDDFRGVTAAELPSFSIVHAGQLRRAPGPLWEALSHAMQQRPELRGRLHLWQIGFVNPSAARWMDSAPEGVIVHHVPPVPQREAIGYMLGADLLLVDEFGSVMPSKTLQYLRAGRPILAFLDAGGLIREVLQPMPQAHLMQRDDVLPAGSMIAALASNPSLRRVAPSDAVVRYSRREIARRFAAVLDEACAPGSARGRPSAGSRAEPAAV
jgi:hypothetical protein